jgi:protein TonB
VPDWPGGPQVLRLAAALGISLGLHAAVAATLDALPYGGASLRSHVEWRPLRAVLGPADAPPGKESSAHPSRAPQTTAGASPRDGSASRPAALPTPYYYRTRELDVRPGITVHVEPEYPQRAALRSLSGTVVARLYIDESGRTDKVEIVRAEPSGVFEEAVEHAFRAARFTPAMKDGRPVRAQMLIEVKFDSPPPPPVEVLVR